MNTQVTILPPPTHLADSWISRVIHDPIGELTRLPSDTANTVNNEATGLLNKGGDELLNTIGSLFGLVGALTGQGQVPQGQGQTQQAQPVNYAPYILGGTILLAGGLILISNRNQGKTRRARK